MESRGVNVTIQMDVTCCDFACVCLPTACTYAFDPKSLKGHFHEVSNLTSCPIQAPSIRARQVKWQKTYLDYIEAM